ncbi:MAG: hypothetical protein Q8K70_01515 [Bacteroidota bacterium]|nr:hypothetical protein [Bacteroidota bacterium]
MIGLFLIYFIGRTYAELAKIYNKNKWLYAILGIVIYYAGTFLLGIIIVILSNVYPNLNNLLSNEFSLTLIGIPFGLISCWVFYKILKRNLSNNHTNKNIFIENQIIDDQIINE